MIAYNPPILIDACDQHNLQSDHHCHAKDKRTGRDEESNEKQP